MKKCINRVILSGYLYEHNLAIKTVKDQTSENFGKEFINGTISIAVDEEGLNVIPCSLHLCNSYHKEPQTKLIMF